jgi:hypothetical protein
MTTVNSIAELEKYINRMAQEAMSKGKSVKNTVIEEGKRQVQKTVYDVYEPKAYERTGKLKENWNWQDTHDGIEIINTRTDDGRYVAEIVETGQGYKFDFEYNGVERPFTKNTADKLRDSVELTNALKKDLKGVGIDSV